jgi:hypothetical protein
MTFKSVTRQSIREEWMDTFFTLCQAEGVKVADEVALRMCVAGYTPADALARYMVLNQK